MLNITVPETELWDERKQEFISTTSKTLQLEHSLVSVSKWESKWHKAFLSKQEKTEEENLDYIRCMTITQNVNPDIYSCLTTENFTEINKYIDDPMTAVYFAKGKGGGIKNRETITSELIYYWMISLNVPFECQKWHLNRLLTLIEVCDIKNKPTKKMGRSELLSRNAALNEARKKQLNTTG